MDVSGCVPFLSAAAKEGEGCAQVCSMANVFIVAQGNTCNCYATAGPHLCEPLMGSAEATRTQNGQCPTLGEPPISKAILTIC